MMFYIFRVVFQPRPSNGQDEFCASNKYGTQYFLLAAWAVSCEGPNRLLYMLLFQQFIKRSKQLTSPCDPDDKKTML